MSRQAKDVKSSEASAFARSAGSPPAELPRARRLLEHPHHVRVELRLEILWRRPAFELLLFRLFRVASGAHQADVLAAAALGHGGVVVHFPAAAQQVASLRAAPLLFLYELILLGFGDGLSLPDQELSDEPVAKDSC